MKHAFVAMVLAAIPSFASAEIVIEDAYARSARPGAPTGAAFMTLQNTSDTEDRLIAVESDAAKLVELHTHIEEDGVMKMRQVEDGFAIPAGGSHALERGGDHVMFMGLVEPFEDGGEVTLRLIFEKAGAMDLTIPVDTTRGQMQHGGMKAGN